MLPLELLSLVCGFLPKPILKQVRQVSKIWERAAVPWLFDEIFISLAMADLRIAKLVILHFKQYIRTLVFSTVYYTEISREGFDEVFDCEFDGEFDGESDIDSDSHKSQPDHAFAIYCIARKKQQANLLDGSAFAYLSFALTSSANIRKIVLTDTSSSRVMSRQSLQAYEPRSSKACPIKQCDLKDTDHIPHAMRHFGFSEEGLTNPWRLVLLALSVTSANVKELTMEPSDMELSTNTAGFSMLPEHFSQAQLCFNTLTKIRFTLNVDTDRFSTKVETRHVHRNVAKLLSSAINLESLSLKLTIESEVGISEYSTLQSILGRCRFPKLRSLILVSLASSEAELLRLLKHSRNLEQLTIRGHNLTEGLWLRVAAWIRASLPLLKHAEFNSIFGGFEEPWADIEYADHHEHVTDFLFDQGENPFTTKALDKCDADTKAKRQMVNPAGDVDFVAA